MKTALGTRLKIRAMVHVAGEPIPYFWPMRTFIHHNPLYGLEHLSFHEAILEGSRLFHGRGYLPRSMYQRYLAEGKIDLDMLSVQIGKFLEGQPEIPGLDAHRLLLTLATRIGEPLAPHDVLASGEDIHAVMTGKPLRQAKVDAEWLKTRLKAQIISTRPVYAVVDDLFGTEIGNDLNELLIKSCLDFFDEGQSVWQMPGRDKGFFSAWSQLARSNLRLFIRGLHIKNILGIDDTPEGIISHVMNELGIPEDDWLDCFTSELTRLHGWAGFIRWRSSAKHYHWSRNYPADLVDYLAIRLVLGLALLREHAHRKGTPVNLADIVRLVDEYPEEFFLRHEFHSGKVLPELAREVEDAISSRSGRRTKRLLPKYLELKR